MVSLWRKGTRREQAAPVVPVVNDMQAAPKRNQQLNLKVSEDCKHVFAEIQRVQGMTAAALFEDFVAERAELLTNAGLLEAGLLEA